MKNKIIFAIFCILPMVGHADHVHSQKLLEVTHGYIDFINHISQGEVPSNEKIDAILASDCKKILNGIVYTENSADFIADLVNVNKTLGCWRITPVDIIPSTESNTVVVRLIAQMEKLGTFTAIAILRYNSEYLITELNEVFSKVEGSYQFEQ